MNFTPSKLHKSSVSIHAENQSYRRIKNENRLQMQCQIERQNTMAAFVSKWQDQASNITWKTNLKKMKDATAEEIALANREFLSLRQKELCQLLKDDKAR
ncbi:hypothetical protein BDV3_006473 [Batrachochytrium dendrobatidis]